MKKIAMATLLALGAVSAAQAQYYGELAYVDAKVKENDIKLSPSMVRAIVGYELSPNVAIEGMVGFGASSSKVTLEDDQGNLLAGKVEISQAAGVYIKPKFKVAEGLELFTRLGMTHGSLKGSAGGLTEKSSTTKFSYGVGASYQISPQMSINADYMHYTKKEGTAITGFAVGVGYKF